MLVNVIDASLGIGTRDDTTQFVGKYNNAHASHSNTIPFEFIIFIIRNKILKIFIARNVFMNWMWNHIKQMVLYSDQLVYYNNINDDNDNLNLIIIIMCIVNILKCNWIEFLVFLYQYRTLLCQWCLMSKPYVPRLEVKRSLEYDDCVPRY